MLCPNCKQELMNVNGRYICVDCGTEVPENEIPVAQAEHDGLEQKIEGNDYTYDELSASAVTPVAEETPEVPTPSDVSLDISSPVTPDALDNPVEMPLPTALPAEENVQNSEKPVEEPISDVAPTQPEVQTEAPQENAPAMPEMTLETTNPVPVDSIGAALNTDTVPQASATSETLAPQLSPETQTPPMATQEAFPEQVSAETQQMEDYTPAPPTPDYSFSPNQQIPEDKAVYQNPLYDQQQDMPEPEQVPIEQTSEYSEVYKRRNIILAILGVFGLIIITGGGVFAYMALTTPAKIAPVEVTDVTDCGSSGPNIAGSDEAKSCFYENFKTCSLAKYSETLDLGENGGVVTMAYEIKGKTDSSCTVESKYTKNPNANWLNKIMSCELDYTKPLGDAISSISASNCTGPLADLMFADSSNSGDDSN